jgi:hypothetical protein
MSSHREPDLEDLLRRSLHEHADKITPADDGLMRIRDQIARRRRPWSIRKSRPASVGGRSRSGSAPRGRLRPTLTAAVVAAAVAAVVAVPVALHDHDSQPHRGLAASQSDQHANAPESGPTESSPTPARPKASAAPRFGNESQPRSTSAVAQPTPGSGDPGAAQTPLQTTAPTAAVLTAWPYQSAAEAKKHAASDVRLRKPDVLATDFVGQFVSADSLTTGRTTTDNGSDLLVTVQRKDTGATVSVVHLVPIDSASLNYLVQGATAPDLTIAAPKTVAATPTVKLSGKFVADSGQTARIWAGVGTPDTTGSITPSDNSMVPPDPSGTWAMAVAPTPLIAHSGVVAVWSVGADGEVVQFAATAVS